MNCTCIAEERLSPPEDMPLNENDRGWIKNAIEEALRTHFKGWKEAIRIYSLPSVCIALLVLAFTQWDKYVEFRTHTGDRLDAIESSVLTLRLKTVASSPVDSESQTEAKNVLATAKRESILLPIPVVAETGRRFVDASVNDPKAWGVAVDYVDYRSLLNVSAHPAGSTGPVPRGVTWKYNIASVTGRPRPAVSFLNFGLPFEKAAFLDFIGADGNKDEKVGPAFLFVRGETVILDGFHFRQVVFQGVEVHYSGSRVILENVVFINCKFVIDNAERGRQFALQVLENSKVSWAA